MASVLSTQSIVAAMWGGAALGVSFSLVHKAFGSWGARQGGKIAKVFIELQRKSFHMIGGCIICLFYHYGIQNRWITPAYGSQAHPGADGALMPLEGGACVLAVCFTVWLIEMGRLSVPAVSRWYLRSFKGLIRQKEMDKAAGIAFFLPGSLAAFLAAEPNLAILGILFLSIGDAGASIGTAAGRIPVFTSSRMVEGSIACFSLCTGIGWFCGLAPAVAAVTAGVVTFGEVLAEIIGLDDNLVIPMLGVLGVRIAFAPQFTSMAVMMGVGLAIGVGLVGLGTVVGATTASGQGRSQQK
eukprot:CAMPEP_0206233608 /NCGR_PEP_ID=MMETSP0047_2-20121206/12104_1 /ASSEMBLY_ACC=CAM_ASM_000192 /TAXON_ID=195065 /ORGANISM="Chroomonas mesostigmatica_cf, Strain CCMP1168" /LENGTH=297 /DNA_ID=CAMNT_0053657551 /DNA_START=123 /DNA_END=1016 /DNA_ORIENTATION=+